MLLISVRRAKEVADSCFRAYTRTMSLDSVPKRCWHIYNATTYHREFSIYIAYNTAIDYVVFDGGYRDNSEQRFAIARSESRLRLGAFSVTVSY